MDTTLADPLVGRLLDGRYRVTSRLARGGMATVYEATDTRLERTVALKVMHPALAEDDEFVARFAREARSAARLSHPNVVAVFDQTTDSGLVYLVMEYVAGRTLRDVLRQRGALPADEALRIMDPVLSALAAAHSAGIVHRDIKPENVLVSDDGTVKVADFGLARAASASTASQATQGVLIGTVAYLSPEQVERGVADARSDVYSAGILLYELVTGSPPFSGETPLAVAYRHVHEDVPAPSSVVPQVPAVVDAIVRSATNRDADLRPADAGRLLALVRRASPGPAAVATTAEQSLHETLVVPLPDTEAARTTAAAGAAATPKVKKPRNRRRRRILVGLLALLIACVGVGYGAWYLGTGRWTTTPAVVSKDVATAQSLLEDAELASNVSSEVYSETIAKGLVISSDPGASERVRRGSEVSLVVSLGPERYAVPDLTGKTVAEATTLLTGTKLLVGTPTQAWSDSLAKGLVISFTPVKGTLVKPQTPVALVVSKGPQPVDVPNVAGKPYGDAVKALEKVALDPVKSGEEFSEAIPKGNVIRQTVVPGTDVAKGTDIGLFVSKGPPLVEVPRVIDKNEADARKALEAAGFKVNVNKPPVSILNRVIFQSPGSGNQAPKGSTVTITIV